MAANSANQINLKTLQRVDSNIVEIIDNTSQVAIYKYERKLEKWEGTDVEGTLFLYRRSTCPYHGFIIVNRMNTTNFVESITSDMQFQLREPYLLYKNHSGDIIGSWFYEQKDLKRISKKIQTIVLKQASKSRRQRCASESDTQPPKDEASSQDIITLLTQAHDKYMRDVSCSQNNTEEEDVNILSGYTNKKYAEKSVPCVRNAKDCPPRSSSQEDSPVSPRRRFMSTGSFDCRRLLAYAELCSNPSLKTNDTKAESTVECKKQSALKEGSSNGSKHNGRILTSRLSPLFSHQEVSSPGANVSNLDEPSNQYHPETESLCPPDWKSQTHLGSSGQGDWKRLSERDAHFTSMKQALKSHIQDHPKLLLQIHEAYISSLRTLFTKH